MRHSLSILVLCIYSFASAQSISIQDFKEIDNLKAEAGESLGKKKALKLEALYLTHNNSDEFQKTLLDYLKNTNYKNIDNYFWFSLYFTTHDYNASINLDLALKLLEAGKTEIENRLQNKENAENQTFRLTMAQCQILWQTGVFYFNADALEKGGAFFDKAYENSDCIHAFPGTTKEKKMIIYEKYSKYRESKKKN